MDRIRVGDDGALVDDGLPLQVPVLRERYGCVRRHSRRIAFDAVHPLLRGSHHARWLIAERLGHGSMLPLHLVVRQIELRFPCLVRRDLYGCSSLLLLLRKMILDLLATWTRCLDVLVAVHRDFRLTTFAVFDLVAQGGEPHGELRPVHRRRILLRLVQLPRLQRADLCLDRVRQIEDHDVRVQLGRGVSVDWRRAVVLELRSHHVPVVSAGRLPSRRAWT